MRKSLLFLSFLAASLSGSAFADDALIRQSLSKLGIEQAEIQPAPIAGLKTVIADAGILYISEDGKHIIQGTLYDISQAQPVNLTNKLLMTKLNGLEKEMIVYPAADQKHVITVFTDITCGYCHKLHEQMKEYNDQGITVRYLAFPRQGLKSQAERDMNVIWCAKDRAKAFDSAMKQEKVTGETCDIDLAKHYQLGVQFGIQGTPAIVLEDGTLIPGYQGPKEMKQLLDAHQKMTKTGG